ncbi:MAG TPA: hypothetical protein VFH37_03170 [Candidatus Saccharimonadales bacterium]|nr:hypothetical protein [Candidatus Saccharimonadales bacterium]
MPQRLHKVKSIDLDLVGAIRRASLRRGFFIPPVSADAADEEEKNQASSGSEANEGSEKSEGKTPPDLTDSQEPQEAHEKLIDVTEKAQDELFTAKSVFPFKPFTDTIILDREKLTVISQTFFFAGKITSVPNSSVSAAEADLGPFFGSVHISSKFFVQNKYEVQMLHKKDAVNLVHLLQGFIIAQEKKIDITDIEKEDLLLLLEDLGTGVARPQDRL